jgi:hypothetical protein
MLFLHLKNKYTHSVSNSAKMISKGTPAPVKKIK